MKKVLCLLMAVAMFALAFAGCAAPAPAEEPAEKPAEDAAATETVTAEPADGEAQLKVITYANGDAPPTFDPITSNYAKTSILAYNLFTGLTRIGANGVAELAYADSYTVSEDGLVWTFHIREDAKFSDGSPLNAHDFADSFIYHMTPSTGAPGIDLKLYVKNAEEYYNDKCSAEDVGIKAIDDYTLEITLKAPTSYFLDIAATYIPYKLDVIKSNPDWAKNAETYIGNGAFRVKEIKPQEKFVLEKNPNWYDVDNNKIDIVNFVFIDDAAVELAAYKNGEIDVSDNLNAEAIATYKDTEEYTACAKIGCKYFTVNCAHAPLDNNLVRQALAYAVDRETLINDVLGLTYWAGSGVVPYGIHWGDKQYRDVVGPLVGFDVAKAQQLLAEAGYPNGEGFPTLTMITMNNQEDIDAAQATQAMWKANLGINVEIVTYESSVYWDVFDTEDWDIGRDSWTGDYDDPQTNMFLWEEYREINDDGTLKDARWHNDASLEYDALLKSTYTELDAEKRMNTFAEAEKLIMNEMPVIPMFFYDDSILSKPNVQGVVKSYLGQVYFNFADVLPAE